MKQKCLLARSFLPETRQIRSRESHGAAKPAKAYKVKFSAIIISLVLSKPQCFEILICRIAGFVSETCCKALDLWYYTISYRRSAMLRRFALQNRCCPGSEAKIPP